MREEATVVVFDFDLTLTRWDTADRFFRWLLRRNPWRMALVIAALPVIGPLFAFRSTRRWPIRFAVWVATLGRSNHDLEALARELSLGESVEFIGAVMDVTVSKQAEQALRQAGN